MGNGGEVKFHVWSHGQVIVLATQRYLVDACFKRKSKMQSGMKFLRDLRICFLHILTYTITWLLTHVCWLNYLLYLSWEHVRCLNIWTHSLRCVLISCVLFDYVYVLESFYCCFSHFSPNYRAFGSPLFFCSSHPPNMIYLQRLVSGCACRGSRGLGQSVLYLFLFTSQWNCINMY